MITMYKFEYLFTGFIMMIYLGTQKSQTTISKQSYCNEQDISNDKSTNNNLEETKIATNEPQLPPEVNNL